MVGPGSLQRRGWSFDVAVLIAAALAGAALSTVTFDNEQTTLALALVGTVAVAVASWKLLVSRHRITAGRSTWLPAAVVGVQATAFTLFSVGTGDQPSTVIAGHQVAWAVSAVVIAAWLLTDRRRAVSAPPWLIAYALVLCGVALAFPSTKAILDAGLSLLALAGMWQLATILARPGGVMQLLRLVAWVCWASLALAVAVEFGGVALGAMTPDSVQLPWEGSISNIFVAGNYIGYGVVTVQGGRELGVLVVVFHFIRFRETRSGLHLTLGVLATIVMLTAYGRVPLVGALVAIALCAASTPAQGLSKRLAFWLVLPITLVLLVPGTADRVTSSATALREGAESFDTGHFGIWTQHLDLLVSSPLVGVGSSPARDVVIEARRPPVFNAPREGGVPIAQLWARGSRGEGGWTGLLAQRGVLGAGLFLALLTAAFGYVLRRYPASDVLERQDMTALRAVLPASLIWYVTDVPPLGVYTFAAFVVGVLTLTAVAKAQATHRPGPVADGSTSPPPSTTRARATS